MIKNHIKLSKTQEFFTSNKFLYVCIFILIISIPTGMILDFNKGKTKGYIDGYRDGYNQALDTVIVIMNKQINSNTTVTKLTIIYSDTLEYTLKRKQ